MSLWVKKNTHRSTRKAPCKATTEFVAFNSQNEYRGIVMKIWN